MYAILGWVNVGITVVMLSPFVLRVLHGKKRGSAAYLKTQKILRTLHKPLGVVLLISAAVHGYLALGALRFHTGTVAGAVLSATVVLGTVFFATRKKSVFTWHRYAAGLFVALLILHLIVPSAFYYLVMV